MPSRVTPGSTAWNLVNTMPEEIKSLLAPCLEPWPAAPQQDTPRQTGVLATEANAVEAPQQDAPQQTSVLTTLVHAAHQHPVLLSTAAAAASMAAYLIFKRR